MDCPECDIELDANSACPACGNQYEIAKQIETNCLCGERVIVTQLSKTQFGFECHACGLSKVLTRK